MRETLAKGDVGEALQRVNALNPDVLETRPELLFALQRQRLVELIRSGELLPALDFASTSLLPLAREDGSGRLMVLLESTLALLAFPDPASQPAAAALAGQLSTEARAELGRSVNSALLEAEGRCPSSRLEAMLRKMLMLQAALKEKASLPQVTL